MSIYTFYIGLYALQIVVGIISLHVEFVFDSKIYDIFVHPAAIQMILKYHMIRVCNAYNNRIFFPLSLCGQSSSGQCVVKRHRLLFLKENGEFVPGWYSWMKWINRFWVNPRRQESDLWLSSTSELDIFSWICMSHKWGKRCLTAISTLT